MQCLTHHATTYTSTEAPMIVSPSKDTCSTPPGWPGNDLPNTTVIYCISKCIANTGVNLINWCKFFMHLSSYLSWFFVITIVKVAVDQRTNLTMSWQNLLSITGQMHGIILFYYDKKLSSCPLLLVDESIDYKFMCSSAYWQYKLTNKRMRKIISLSCLQNLRPSTGSVI